MTNHPRDDRVESRTLQSAVDRAVKYFETITPDSIAALGEIYSENCAFKDPFNAVSGLAAIQAIFSHMFVQLDQPRFVVRERVLQGDQAFLTWEFHFYFRRFQRGQAQCILGASHLRFAGDGRIALHRDYWDAAEELYEKLPLLGGLMRALKAQARG